MSIFTSLAQSSLYSYDYSNDSLYQPGDTENAVMVLLILVFVFLFMAAIYAFYAICAMRIFKKAGVDQWIAWVPFYNNWKLLEIGGQYGFWSVLAIIPFVNIVSSIFMYIAQYHIGKKLGHSGEFVLWAIFIPIVWFVWIAFEQSKWNDSASSAPSLHKA